MSRPISSLLLLLMLIATAPSVYAAMPVHLWSQRFGSTSNDIGNTVATDASGNVFVTGYFQGTVDFGSGNLVSAGGNDIFVAKYSPTGAHLWSQRFGSTSDDWGRFVATDASGNVFVTGYFQGTVDFGGGNLVSAGSSDIFVAKYSPTGTHLWSQRFGSTSGDSGRSVSTDASGNVFVTGYFAETVDFGGGNLVSAGLNDIFVVMYSPTGTHLWSQRFGSAYSDWGRSVSTDASGNVFVTGDFQETVDFGGGNLVSAGVSDIFVAKYGPAGAHLWSQRFGATGNDRAWSLATDASGNVFVTGDFQGTVDFGGGDLVSAGLYDIFVAKYSPTGTHLWSQRFGSTNNESESSVATDASGDAFVTGYFYDIVDFGGGNLVSAGLNDIFVAKYTSNPAPPLITSIADIANDQGGWVRAMFVRSGLDDTDATSPSSQYGVWRRVDDLAPGALLENGPGAAVVGETAAAFSGLPLFAHRGRILARSAPEWSTTSLPAGTWELVASVPALQAPAYMVAIPTVADSTQDGAHYTVLVVTAHTTTPSIWYASAPDSGYSLDNLAPGVPQNFIYNAGNLSWDESAAEDFDYFTVYGANVDAFASATVVDYSVAPTMDVSGSPYVFYYVTATDFSGNEGKPAKVNTLSSVGDTPKSYVLSVTNYPNPFNPGTTVKYTVPSRGRVTIAVYDLTGAHVATLFQGERTAGVYDVVWDGRADAGSVVSSGVYFARVEHASGVRTRKMVLLK